MVISYNKHEGDKVCSQYGGTGIIAREDIVHRITGTGRDGTVLGRWNWIQVQGRRGQLTRIVSGYRPQHSTELGSAYEQHKRYFKVNGGPRDPIKAFDEDLARELNQWKEDNEEVILGLDGNDDVRKGPLYDWSDSLGLTEAVCSRHGNRGPTTQQTNTRRKPIDGIWTTGLRHPTRAGYFAFGDGVQSDHRLVWADFDQHDLYGTHVPPRLTHRPED